MAADVIVKRGVAENRKYSRFHLEYCTEESVNINVTALPPDRS